MNICIAGKNSIAINVCENIRYNYSKAKLYALSNKNDTGVDSWQPSFLRYIQSHPKDIKLSSIQEISKMDDLVFLSLEYDRIINPLLFRTTRLYNIHFSLLPAYKGVYTSVWPILNGEKESGVTLHKIDSGIDTGDIIRQQRFPISKEETAASLYEKLILSGTKLVINELPLLLGKNQPIATQQPPEGSTYYSKDSINFSQSLDLQHLTATQIKRWIQALYFPAYQYPIIYNNKIERAQITSKRSILPPGTIISENKILLEISTIDYDIILFKYT